MIIKGEKKVKFFESDAAMDPRGSPKGSRPNSDCKERKNVKKFEFDAKMGPVLIEIVKRKKNVKKFEFDAQTDPGGAQKGLGPTGLLKKKIYIRYIFSPKKENLFRSLL